RCLLPAPRRRRIDVSGPSLRRTPRAQRDQRPTRRAPGEGASAGGLDNERRGPPAARLSGRSAAERWAETLERGHFSETCDHAIRLQGGPKEVAAGYPSRSQVPAPESSGRGAPRRVIIATRVVPIS